MSKFLTRLSVSTRNDEGQGAVEYIGILAVAAVVITVVVAAVNGNASTIQSGLTTLINDVLRTR